LLVTGNALLLGNQLFTQLEIGPLKYQETLRYDRSAKQER